MTLVSDPPPAFNVTIRSDRRGTCKGTHVVFACVGYCESSAFPSRYSVLVASNFTHNITSASRCCTISRDTKVSGVSGAQCLLDSTCLANQVLNSASLRPRRPRPGQSAA